ncbi:GSCFA domain-containing protein [Polaribacter haliotis]|uniref:GSCFA domain-containing protein n=1 Tax=Polaribacter haliotis TaxID=1888915 RepID=A0A7L8ADU0_9FLAO|nr:GSCFA domain-containing protein [Polaribacter haliotis]QOD60183.1 GSCFA domain-containing protein [Polaribacter haliotis]
MNFLTQIPIKKEERNPINYDSKLLLIGSCFSENIGEKLSYYKFQSNQNPFGILFQPKAIEHLVTNAINEKIYSQDDLIYQNERWHCFDAHSSLSSANKNELLENLNSALRQTKKQLEEATHIVITLGTSWVYRFIETDAIVANCHKIPQKKFLKELLSVNEVSEILEGIVALIKSVNSSVQIIFTVSPVRHLKDGFVENTQSKSHLISGICSIINSRNNIHYFPSYEIMMDELRDYRFYNEDMIHPNTTAVNYIWNKFSSSWFSEEAQKTMQEIETIQKGISHRPFNENSEQHQKFLKNLDLKISEIQSKLPFVKFQ